MIFLILNLDMVVTMAVIKDILRNEHGFWVGNFYCDDNSWIIYSDYGTYAHTFYYRSGTLKEFLIRCNSDYLCRKLLPIEEREEIDWKNSKKEIMKSILEGRRNNCYESENARTLYDAIKYCYDIEDYKREIDVVDDWWECLVHTQSQQRISFEKYVIKPILELYKQQMEKI